MNGENQSLNAVDRFSKWPTVKICRTSETKQVINFPTQNFKLYERPENKSNKSGAFNSKEHIEFCKSKNNEIELCTPRIHIGTGAVERAIQAMKNLIMANFQFMLDGMCY